jgi:type II secretory pathway pseudopilin PulG
MVELVVVLGIVMIVLALLLPALLYAREYSRRSACQSHLRQIGLAVLQYESVHGVFPAGRDAAGGRDHCWATAILPQLELTNLYQMYNYDYPWNDNSPGVQNFQVATTTLPLFLCPSTVHSQVGATDYGGNYGSSLTGLAKGFGIGLAWDSGVLLALNTPSRTEPRTDLITLGQISDGASQTFLVVEDAGRAPDQGGQWADGQQCLAHEYKSINEYRQQGIYSDHPGGAHALTVDARVLFLSIDTDPYVLGAYCTRSNGEVMSQL